MPVLRQARGRGDPVTPTHAFVGYDRAGTAIVLLVDDGRRETSHAAVQYPRNGWRFERMPIEDARKVWLYEGPRPR